MSGTVYLVGAGPGAGRTGLPEKNRIRVEIVPGVTAALAADTVVIYMGAGEAESIAGVLTGAGKSPATPVALVEPPIGEQPEVIAAIARAISGPPA